jgi:hypothetical protein
VPDHSSTWRVIAELARQKHERSPTFAQAIAAQCALANPQRHFDTAHTKSMNKRIATPGIETYPVLRKSCISPDTHIKTSAKKTSARKSN